jgi:hypothetical protein
MNTKSTRKTVFRWVVCLISVIGVIIFYYHINSNITNMDVEDTTIDLPEITTEVTTSESTTSESTTSESITTTTTTEESTTTESTTIKDITISVIQTSLTETHTNATTKRNIVKITQMITEKASETPNSKGGLTCLGSFKGTYYSGKSVPCKGGSGRTLINCTTSSSGIKGSVASRYVYRKYGYKKGGRTKVWIECSGMPSMTGWYYVDDCCGANNVIDFYYLRNSNCPFRKSGVISVKVYI